MEKLNLIPQTVAGLKINEYEKKFTLDKHTSFEDAIRAVSLMGSFGIYKATSTYHEDFYYDTFDRVLKSFNASVRMRTEPLGKTVSVKYKIYQEGEDHQVKEIVKEYETKVDNDADIVANEDIRIFIEDKLRDIYAHHVDLDILRKLKELRPILVVRTDRVTQHIKNNEKFTCTINYDEVQYKTKRAYDTDNVVEIKLTCPPTKENLAHYERFLRELRMRVVLIPMPETKYEVGMRVSNYTRDKRVKEEEE